MAEIKNTFLKGKMNQDLDSRILPNGEYREAFNLAISRSEGSSVGEFENILGNEKVGIFSVDGVGITFGAVIGNYVDETNNVVYVLVTNCTAVEGNRCGSTKMSAIFKIYLENPYTISTLVAGNFLNFSQNYIVTGINLIDDFLFWTDNYNQPRKINVVSAEDNYVSQTNQYYTTEEQISVAKYSPYLPAVLMERSSTTVTATAAGAVVMTVASVTGIKVGDIITDHRKASGVTELINTLTTVTNIAGSVISFLPALVTALPASFAIDFSRPSMTNQNEINLSNHSTQEIGNIMTSTQFRINPFVYGGLPRSGDYITRSAGTAISFANDIKVVSVNITGAQVTITVDKDIQSAGSNQLAVNDVIEIAKNPNYSSDWSGDPTWLEDKFVRFSYRFQYEDNEYSLMAPFSQIAFIPKQYSEFGAGQLNQKLESGGTVQDNYSQDMVNAYKSTIISWFENNTDNINVRIPIPSASPSLFISSLKVKNIDILYKESDSLAVKVLDTITLSSPTPTFSSISYEDDIHGTNTQFFYDYNYTSSKPYKTLPQNQTTRVYDKVPIKALAQELIGNRVVYGNYLEKMTPPSSLPYSVNINKKSVVYDNFTQYPYHTVKQNRNYQVGFVLSDIYGRQSDVILSANDNSSTTAGSTVFFPYFANGTDADVFNWIGSALNVSVQQPIGQTVNTLTGEPGLYSDGLTVESLEIQNTGQGYAVGSNIATTTSGAGTGLTIAITSVSGAGAVTGLIINNLGSGYVDQELITISGGTSKATFKVNVPISNPLGWYSYKIVVKQQEQEYYNAYLPGFVNGLPIIDFPTSTNVQQLNQFAFSTLLSDNINKIPRSLTEVGPTDTEFNSDEILYVRVNNPDIVYGGVFGNGFNFVTNKQYYPGNFNQEVLSISTVKDTELVSIPFKPNVAKGDYGSTTNVAPSNTATVQLTGAIPYGTTGANESLYNTDQDPFMLKITGSDNINNPIGAIVTANAIDSAAANTKCMAPILTIAETKPVYSLLDIYWETSLTGKISDLNRAINNTFNGVSGLTITSFTFPESIANANTSSFDPNTGFEAIDGSGLPIGGTAPVPTVTIESINTESGQTVLESNWPFELENPSTYNWRLKTKTIKFVFTENSLNNFIDNYIVQLKCVYAADGVAANEETTFFNINANLTNVPPTLDNCTAPTGITINSIAIKTFTASNGSSDTTRDTEGLLFSLGAPVITGTSTAAPGIFSIATVTDGAGVTTGELTANQTQADLTSYTVPVTVTDASGSGETSAVCNLVVAVGAEKVPRSICNGRQGGAVSLSCGKNSEWLFAQTNNTALTAGGLSYPVGAVYPSNALYNVRASYSSGSCATGALSQGIMTLKPTLNGGTAAGNAIVTFWIQYRSSNSQAWEIATAESGSGLETQCGGLQTTAAGNAANTVKQYRFSVLGEYRVVTNYISGDNCAGNPNFFVDFSDAAYPGVACGTANPC